MIRNKRLFFISLSLLVLVGVSSAGAYTRFASSTSKQSEASNAPVPTIKIEIFTGAIFVTPQDSTETVATNNQAIAVGSTIRTNETGRGQVVFSTGTVVRVDHVSSFTITEADVTPQQTVIGINNGRVWSRVTKLLGKESFETQTPTVVATVRGTSYGHGILADGRNKLQATKRAVMVTCRNNTQGGLITPQTKFFLDCKDGSPSTIEQFDETDTQDEWYLFNVEQDRLLDERFGKERYDDYSAVLAATAKASPTVTSKATTKATPTTSPLSPTLPPGQMPLSTLVPTQSPTPWFTPSPTPSPSPSVTPVPKSTPTPSPGRPLPLNNVNPEIFRNLIPAPPVLR